MKTTVINIHAGPGAGKSVLAAQLFAEFKIRGKQAELAHEWVKGWAWEGRVPKGSADALYIFAKQLKTESRLWGKVEYVITDSPLGLSVVYEAMYRADSKLMFNTYRELLNDLNRQGNVHYCNLHLKRQHPYQTQGRFEDEKKAREVDILCHQLHGGWTVDGFESAVKLLEGMGYL